MSSDIAEMDRKSRHQLKKGILHAHKLIAASNFIKDDLVRLGVSADKITVIHNGIDHKLFFPMADIFEDEIVDIKPFAIKRPYFVYGSTLSSPEKKHIELIKAFELFKKNTGAPHRLVLAGNDGPYAEEIHKVAFDSPYASDIFLTGFFPHENFARLYGGAEACLFPSVNEGVGLPILEAMACGLAVVSFDCPWGPQSIIKNGEDGFLVENGNIEKMADALVRLIEDDNKRHTFAKNAIQNVKRFQMEKIAEQWRQLFENVIRS